MALLALQRRTRHLQFLGPCGDGSTTWSGVSNPQAQKNSASSIKKGQTGVFFYHTGKEKAGGSASWKWLLTLHLTPLMRPAQRVVVMVKPIRKLKSPVTLAAIKAEKPSAQWELVKQARLSVMPVPEELWAKIEKMSSD